ncbi:MAG: Lrp/AsnC family transcriptional regulator [Candidatus Nanohaloarchaea archaeon]|nr:Lrp/AsnC family transcriptional regulator [Candidatus Nanohaloarchaea archaeon]
MVDDLDREILSHLTEDGRKSFREIAEHVDTTPVTVTNRVNKLQEAGVIENYSVNLNHEHLGYDVSAIIGLEISGDRAKLRERLEDCANILSMYRVTGSTDITIVGKFESQDKLSSFVKGRLLDENDDIVDNVNTQIIMDVYRENHALDPA